MWAIVTMILVFPQGQFCELGINVAYAGQETRQCLSHYMSVSHSSRPIWWLLSNNCSSITGVCHASGIAPDTVTLAQSFETWCGIVFGQLFLHSQWNHFLKHLFPRPRRGSPDFGSSSEARFCRRHPGSSLGQERGLVWLGEPNCCSWSLCPTVEFPNYENKAHLFEEQTSQAGEHRPSGEGSPTRPPIITLYHLFSHSISPFPAKGFRFRLQSLKMWVQVPSSATGWLFDLGQLWTLLNLVSFIYEVRNMWAVLQK